jgi:hypothetical protein
MPVDSQESEEFMHWLCPNRNGQNRLASVTFVAALAVFGPLSLFVTLGGGGPRASEGLPTIAMGEPLARPGAVPGAAFAPVSHSLEILEMRAIERASDLFVAYFGADYQSRPLSETSVPHFRAADGGPGGDYRDGLATVIAVNPPGTTVRLLRPRVIRSTILPDPSAAQAQAPNATRGPIAAKHIARSGFAVEFICYLQRKTPNANDASDVSSSTTV